jgi:HK97 family phage prohead protease
MKEDEQPKQVKQYAALDFLEHKTLELEGSFSGHGAAYALDLVGDRIEPGAFASTIKATKGSVPILKGHDPDKWIGQTDSLEEDAKGLYTVAALFLSTDDGRNAHGLLKDAAARKIRVGMSIGFYAEAWKWDADTRVLTKINLVEISITGFPANPKAQVAAVKSARTLETYFRVHCGLSREMAREAVINSKVAFSGGMPELINHSNIAAALKDAGLGEKK